MAEKNDVTKKEEVNEEVVSADACGVCQGHGLIGNPAGQNKVCEACTGTGKANGAGNSEFPDGTTLVRADGQYIVQDGKEVKV